MKHATFAVALSVAAIVTLASATAQAACCAKDCAAVGCNKVTSQTVAAPHIEAPVFVNLRTTCDGRVVKQCQSTFVVPPFQCCTTAALIGKCHLLAQSIRLNPDCQELGYSVVETCDLNQTFEVTDDGCTSGVTELGITCNPDTFSMTGAGQPIPCDYEGDLITPGCVPLGPLEPVVAVTLRGLASALDIIEPVVPGHPPAQHLFVKHPALPLVELIEEVKTTGDTAARILEGLAGQIRGGVLGSTVDVTTTDAGETLILRRKGVSTTGGAVGAALANNAQATDPLTGDRHGFIVGTRNATLATLPIAPALPRGPKSGKAPRSKCGTP